MCKKSIFKKSIIILFIIILIGIVILKTLPYIDNREINGITIKTFLRSSIHEETVGQWVLEISEDGNISYKKIAKVGIKEEHKIKKSIKELHKRNSILVFSFSEIVYCPFKS